MLTFQPPSEKPDCAAPTGARGPPPFLSLLFFCLLMSSRSFISRMMLANFASVLLDRLVKKTLSAVYAPAWTPAPTGCSVAGTALPGAGTSQGPLRAHPGWGVGGFPLGTAAARVWWLDSHRGGCGRAGTAASQPPSREPSGSQEPSTMPTGPPASRTMPIDINVTGSLMYSRQLWSFPALWAGVGASFGSQLHSSGPLGPQDEGPWPPGFCMVPIASSCLGDTSHWPALVIGPC